MTQAENRNADWLTKEDYKKFGYPESDPRFESEEWNAEQIWLDSVDPRHNPNLLTDPSDPEYWYAAARKPLQKAALRTEQHWHGRRRAWTRQCEAVECQNKRREDTSSTSCRGGFVWRPPRFDRPLIQPGLTPL
ncbi:unnamed protein product [Prorocentrum cordatum]|uniref:Uncharacterized protein n=1 Tax=Prorocentrum cordatum TaxID=2364126 RepID=A0ABN9VWT9_9DINO|nr:unnamed protein product [Polarella glacialis]